MLKRLITGLFILLIVAGFIALKYVNILIFDAFILIVMYGALIETVNVYKKAGKKIDILIYLVPLALCTIFNLEKDVFKAFGYIILFSIIFVLYLLTIEIINYSIQRKNDKIKLDNKDISESENSDNLQELSEHKANEKIDNLNKTLFDRTKYTMQVYIYPLILLSFFFVLNHLGYTISDYNNTVTKYQVGFIGIILAFAVSMMTDTFAYVFGRLFGKRKFIPEVSPNKTIAGMVGGFVGGIVASAVCLLIFINIGEFSSIILEKKDTYILIYSIIGVCGAWADQLGDLVASALKRKVGVKDYSHIFPGHGGFMDRIDGLMFTNVLITILFALFLV